jgi:hypothetical protein
MHRNFTPRGDFAAVYRINSIKIYFAFLTLAVILVFSQSAVFAQPNLSAPVPLPGDTTPLPAMGKQEKPQISKGGETFLAVWTDTRTALAGNGSISVGGGGPYFGTGLGTMNDIYAARLDQSGNVIDRYPIVVNQDSYNQSYPQVAWNGQNWLVVWYQEQADSYYNYEIRGVRVSPEGQVLDAAPFLIGAPSNQIGGFPVSLLFDGTNWVVFWENFNEPPTARVIYAARVSPAGAVLDAQGVAVYNHQSQFLADPDVAFNGTNFLAVFVDMNDNKVYGLRVSTALQQIGNKFVITNYSPSNPTNLQVASNGDGFLAVWDEHIVNGNVGGVRGARVSSAGVVPDTNPIVIDSNVGISESSPNAVWNGTNWYVAYDSGYYSATDTYIDTQDVYVKRVSTAGAVLDTHPMRATTAVSHQAAPAIAAGFNNSVQIVWHDLRIEEDIYGVQVGAAGAVGAERAIALGAPRQSGARTAFGGGVFLSVFLRETAGNAQIYGHRIDALGNPLDAAPFLLSSTANRLNFSPSVAFNGTHFLVVWHRQESDDIGNIFWKVYGRRVSPSGEIVDAAPFFVMDGQTPDIAALGDTFLVAAIKPFGSQIRNVEAVRVSGAGTVLGAPVVIIGNFNFGPRVAALGNRWLVVWEYHSRHDNFQSWIRGSFVDAGGAATPSFQVAAANDIAGNYDNTPHLASAGSEALIVWQDGDEQNNIRGRLIQADGTLLGGNGFTISNAPGSQFSPAVTWNGSRYISVWIDQRNEQFPVQPRGDIYGARIEANGTVADPDGFVVADSPFPEETPYVSSGNGVSVFSYSRFYDAAPFSAMRVTVRTSSAVVNSATPFDFDGDSKTDISVFRPADGSWWYSRSSDNAFRVYSFGASSDVLAPGDFTGDGKADLAVFRPATGEWFIRRSENNTFFSFPFGAAGDVPVPADYDGDRKTDAAVFRPSTGTWFILNSSGTGTSIVNFGSSEDKPVPADFDGDGKADIAIFRAADGSWWYLRSSDSQFRVYRFGVGTDKPVQGDYTGDGKADLAIFRPSTGEWFFQRSEDNSFYSLPFGATGDLAVPGDYDGDGRFDTAVFRPSTANWFVQRSTAGILIAGFGAAGDRPVPNAFVP